MSKMLREFREFIARGSVIDLAVGIVIGAAFTAVVNHFVSDILNAFIGAVFSKPTFNALSVHVGHGVIHYGRFITAILNFLIIGFALFLVVRAINSMRRKEDEASDTPELTEKDVLVEIRDLLAEGDGRGNSPISR